MDLQTYLTKSYLRPNRQILQGLGATDEQIRYIMETPSNFNWSVWGSVSGNGSGTNRVVLAIINSVETIEQDGPPIYMGRASELIGGQSLFNKAVLSPTEYNIYVNNIQLNYMYNDSSGSIYGDEDDHIGVKLTPNSGIPIMLMIMDTLDMDPPVTISIEEKAPITLPHTVHLINTNMLDDNLTDEEYGQALKQNGKEILDLQKIYSKFGNGTIGSLTIEGVDNFIVAAQKTLLSKVGDMEYLLDENGDSNRAIRISISSSGLGYIRLYSVVAGETTTVDLNSLDITIQQTPGYVITNGDVKNYVKQGDTFTFPTGENTYYMVGDQRYESGQTIIPTGDFTYTMHQTEDAR